MEKGEYKLMPDTERLIYEVEQNARRAIDPLVNDLLKALDRISELESRVSRLEERARK